MYKQTILRFALVLVLVLPVSGCEINVLVTIMNLTDIELWVSFEWTRDELADDGDGFIYPGESETIDLSGRIGDMRNVRIQISDGGDPPFVYAEKELDMTSETGTVSITGEKGNYQIEQSGFDKSTNQIKEEKVCTWTPPAGTGGGSSGSCPQCDSCDSCVSYKCDNLPLNNQSQTLCAAACVYDCYIPCDPASKSECNRMRQEVSNLGGYCSVDCY